MNRSTGHSQGFTLIELVVTLTVAAILLAVAVPNFSDLIDRARVRGAADDVVSLISNARGEAVKRSRDVTINMGGTAAGWCIGANEAATPAVADAFAASAACDCVSAGSCTVQGGDVVLRSAGYSGVTASAVTMSFTIDGKLGATSNLAGATVNFTSPKGNNVVTVQVSPLGQTRACTPSGKPSISGYPTC